MKIKTADLIGAPLDWAVAKIDQPQWSDDDCRLWVQDYEYQYSPSTIWSQGGPLIEREEIGLEWGPRLKEMEWLAWLPKNDSYGPTPLIAAMRCFVASRLGDEVEVPDELME